MAKAAFRPGFRLSSVDVIVLLAGLVSAVVIYPMIWWLGVAIMFVVGHFFLFCNILRAARPLELTWTTCFLALAMSSATLGMPDWPLTFALSLLVTLVVVMLQLRRPSYHGVGWHRINPGLTQWWETHGAQN